MRLLFMHCLFCPLRTACARRLLLMHQVAARACLPRRSKREETRLLATRTKPAAQRTIAVGAERVAAAPLVAFKEVLGLHKEQGGRTKGRLGHQGKPLQNPKQALHSGSELQTYRQLPQAPAVRASNDLQLGAARLTVSSCKLQLSEQAMTCSLVLRAGQGQENWQFFSPHGA